MSRKNKEPKKNNDKKKRSKLSATISAFTEKHGRIIGMLFIPFLFVWLEVFLHVFDKTGLRFSPIFVLFGISAGFAVSSFGRLFKTSGRRIYTGIWTGILTVLYGAEFIAKEILQTYYPFSIMDTAAGNKLYQFIGIVIETVALKLFCLAVMVLPAVFYYVYSKQIFVNDADISVKDQLAPVHQTSEQEAQVSAKINGRKTARKEKNRKLESLKTFVLSIVLFALFHAAGLSSLNLPYKGDLLPSDLYKMDINYNEQVEQLGLYSMLRLDVKHMFVEADYTQEFDPSVLAQAEPDEEKTQDQPQELPPKTPDGETQSEISPNPGEAGPAPEEPPVPEIDRSPNVMDVDFKTLAEKAPDKDTKWLCDYFGSLPGTNKNEYTGMFKDFNVVFFTIEAFDSCAVSEKYTPTLYKLMNEGFVFNNFYSSLHFTSTSNGECQNLLGLYPKNGKPITMVRTGQLKTNTYFTLARQLNRLGYVSLGYHNNWDLYDRSSSHPNAGYDWNYCSRGLNYEKTSGGDLKWPQRDSFMIEDSIDDYINSDKPFNIYYLTVSAHTPYSWNWVASQYREQLADCEYSEQTKAYIATVMECDKALKILLDKLEEAGKLENTLIVAVPDHIPYTAVESIEEMTGKKLGTSAAASAIDEKALDLDVYKNGLIIWSAAMKEPVTVDKVCCQVDVLPTVSNLLGLEYDSRMLSGTDALSDSEGMVVFSSRCWKTDKGLYNRFTQEFTPAEGVEMTPEETAEYVEKTKALAGYRLDCTSKIVERNFYEYVFPQSAE